MALTNKQLLVLEDMLNKIKRGENMKAVESHHKFYDTKSEKSAKVLASRNLSNPDFRSALLDGLSRQKIIGANSKVEKRLTEGLDAQNNGEVDFRARLEYIKEINKVSGVYAPERKETKSMILKANISEEELDEKIQKLQEELK